MENVGGLNARQLFRVRLCMLISITEIDIMDLAFSLCCKNDDYMH